MICAGRSSSADLAPRREHAHAAAQIDELAHVAGPAVLDEPRLRFRVEPLGLDAQLVRCALEVMIEQLRDIFTPRAQRRQLDADDVQPVIEVLAELAVAHALLEIPVRRGDHAHIDPQRRLAADPVELAFGQHAQQPRLQRQRHVADLIEEQRAAVGLLETAAPLRIRAGERALLVTEQLRLEQLARESPRC